DSCFSSIKPSILSKPVPPITPNIFFPYAIK
ncbi:MAG: hypothetical protein ACI8WO_000664, partial [Methylophilaceae bacterium]